MLLELGKFASLLLSILCLIALFHTLFLMPDSGFEARIVASLEMWGLAFAVSLGSGWIFCRWERKIGVRNPSLGASLPMLLFWWASAALLVLFAAAWYLEKYYFPLRSAFPA